MEPDTMRDLAEPLFDQLGIEDEPLISPMPGSSLQRTFRLRHAGTDRVLKWYPPVPEHLPDPLFTELYFYEHLRALGIRSAPEVITYSESTRTTVFSFMAGRPLKEGEITLPKCVEAVTFLATINRQRCTDGSRELESLPERECSLGHLLDSLDPVILQGLPQNLLEVQPLVTLWEDELMPAWQQLVQYCLTFAETSGMDLNESLDAEHAILTPGEFTFHNILLTPEQGLVFCDFEHARHAHPAATLARFMTQPDFPVKETFTDSLLDTLQTVPDLDPLLGMRLRLFLPVIRMERALSLLFPDMDWNRDTPVGDIDEEGKIQLVQHIWQARQQIKAAMKHIE